MGQAADDALYVEDEIPICDRVCRREGVRTVAGRAFPIEHGSVSSVGYPSYLLDYNTSGNRVRQQRLDGSGQVIRRWRYAAGKPLEELAYDKDGQLEWRREFVYGTAALWQEQRLVAASGEPIYCVVAERDATGRLLAAKYVQAGGEADGIRRDTYRDDGRGRLVAVDMGTFGDSVFEYGADHDLLTRRTRNLPGASAFGDVLELEYDARGLPVRVTHEHWSVTLLEYKS